MVFKRILLFILIAITAAATEARAEFQVSVAADNEPLAEDLFSFRYLVAVEQSSDRPLPAFTIVLPSFFEIVSLESPDGFESSLRDTLLYGPVFDNIISWEVSEDFPGLGILPGDVGVFKIVARALPGQVSFSALGYDDSKSEPWVWIEGTTVGPAVVVPEIPTFKIGLFGLTVAGVVRLCVPLCCRRMVDRRNAG